MKADIERDNVNHMIACYIRQARVRCHYSMKEAAKRLGVSYQQLSKYERGDTQIAAALLFRMAELYQASVEEFFPVEASRCSMLFHIMEEVRVYPDELQHLIYRMMLFQKNRLRGENMSKNPQIFSYLDKI